MLLCYYYCFFSNGAHTQTPWEHNIYSGLVLNPLMTQNVVAV